MSGRAGGGRDEECGSRKKKLKKLISPAGSETIDLLSVKWPAKKTARAMALAVCPEEVESNREQRAATPHPAAEAATLSQGRGVKKKKKKKRRFSRWPVPRACAAWLLSNAALRLTARRRNSVPQQCWGLHKKKQKKNTLWPRQGRGFKVWHPETATATNKDQGQEASGTHGRDARATGKGGGRCGLN